MTQHSPSPFPHWQQTASPDDILPPPKRQRLSPTSTSPAPYIHSPQPNNVSSPNYQYPSLPNTYQNRQVNGLPEAISRQPSGVMGPPQRPIERPGERSAVVEKRVDVNDLTDLITSSGIDIREEENFLAASYRSEQQAAQNAQNRLSYDVLSRNNYGGVGSRTTSFSHGTPQKSAEEELYEKHKSAARAQNEAHQFHLDNPFLQGALMRTKIVKIAGDNGVIVPVEGLWDRIPDRPAAISGTSATGTNGSSVLAVKAPSILNRNTPLEGILSLLSLAANERIRGLLEDAYGLARGRQTSSDGVVPPAWSDIAVMNGSVQTTAIPESIVDSAWDQPPESNKNTLPSPPDSIAGNINNKIIQPLPTIAFPPAKSGVSLALTSLTKRDRLAEEKRLKRRTERIARKSAGDPALTNGELVEGQNGAGLLTGTLGDRAPEQPKLTKKEKERLAKQDLSEEAQTRNANTTAVMQMGGKKYAWMEMGKKNSGAPSGLGMGIGGSRPLGSANTTPAKETPKAGLAAIKDRKFGSWREDSTDGKDVQLRDWVGVLEADGKERKTLNFALARLGKEPAPPPDTSSPAPTKI